MSYLRRPGGRLVTVTARMWSPEGITLMEADLSCDAAPVTMTDCWDEPVQWLAWAVGRCIDDARGEVSVTVTDCRDGPAPVQWLAWAVGRCTDEARGEVSVTYVEVMWLEEQ